MVRAGNSPPLRDLPVRSQTFAALIWSRSRLSQWICSAPALLVDSSPKSSRSKWEHGMPMRTFRTETHRVDIGKSHQEVAQFIEGHVNRVANGRIRDLHVDYSDDRIVL